MSFNIRNHAKNLADKSVKVTKKTTETVKEFAQTEDAKAVGRNMKEMGKGVLTSDIGKHAVAGAGLGAVIGGIVPLVGTVLGAKVGLVYGVYKGIIK